MPDRGLTSSRRTGTMLSAWAARFAALAAALMVALPTGLLAQSLRRSPVKLGAPKQEKPEAREPKESDVRIGKIVWADGKSAAAIVQKKINLPVLGGWSSFYYACDDRLTPVASLSPAGISHRNCEMFLISDGSAAPGDSLFVKIIPPKKDLLEQLEE